MTAALDWQHEWITSVLWTLEAFALTLLGCALLAWLLPRSTTWGRQFARLAYPYFRPGRDRASWRPLATVLLILLMGIVVVRLSVLLSFSNNGLMTAMQQLNQGSFFRYLEIFAVLAVIWVVRYLVLYYIQQAFTIHWRIWLNDHVVDDWLRGRAYLRSQFVHSAVDNPDQRIQEDVTSFVGDSQSLAFGMVNSAVSLVSFTAVLWGLSGSMAIAGIEIPRAMTFISYVYVIVATMIAFRIGRPLIRLDFMNQALNAAFRYALVRLRFNAENVAFYHGEDAERTILSARFGAVIGNAWALLYRYLKLGAFNDAVDQVAAVFPYVIQAPRFFSRAITLGDVTQTATAFGSVYGALSYFRNAYSDFAGYRATLDRLTGLLDANLEARQLPAVTLVDRSEGLTISGLTVRRPDGQPLIEDLSLSLAPGEAFLVKGPSGSGKTCLLRSLADLWPYATGCVSRPTGGHALFLPQEPYVPLGTLRAALAYPGPPELLGDDEAREVLCQLQLGHLRDHLDDDGRWARGLSPGERQRLGFARLLVSRPRVAFLDEATSNLDVGQEHALYTLVRHQLPGCILLTVGHRSSLDALHAGHLELLGDGRWRAAPAPMVASLWDGAR